MSSSERGAERAIRGLLAAEVGRHEAVISDPRVSPDVRASPDAIRKGGGDPGRTLLDLSQTLSTHHGAKVVLLIDEYDASVLNAWEHGYTDDAVAFSGACCLRDSRTIPSCTRAC
ncbi:MAG: hypothetical protein EXR69_13790 [Myxococcales bacterium]|nr:hypothetical protein [Myxococcales bacterium]